MTAALGKELVALLLEAATAEMGATLAKQLIATLDSPHFALSTPHNDAPWISTVDGSWLCKDGCVFSAYYHPTLEHRVTTVGALGQKTSTAPAGKWAVSYQTKARTGNQALYNTYPFK